MTMKYGLYAAAAILLISTIDGYYNYEEPSFLGQTVWTFIYPDRMKDVSDFAEFVHARYKTNAESALEALKKYYGIEYESQAKTLDALSRGPKPTPGNRWPTPEVEQALILAFSQSVYGYGVASTREQLIDLKARSATASRNVIAEEARAIEEAARNAPPPENPLEKLYGPSKTLARVSEERTILTITRGISGEEMKGRITELKEMGVLSEETSSKLESAFKRATKSDVPDAEEFTKRNQATPEELREFANAAMEILVKNDYSRGVADTMVNVLITPEWPL